MIHLDNIDKIIIHFEQNDILLIRKNNPSNIIGIFTHGVATCGTVIISFNNDSILLASHFDETFDLINRIKDKIQSISNEKIYNIKIFYSQGQGPINNKFINN